MRRRYFFVNFELSRRLGTLINECGKNDQGDSRTLAKEARCLFQLDGNYPYALCDISEVNYRQKNLDSVSTRAMIFIEKC